MSTLNSTFKASDLLELTVPGSSLLSSTQTRPIAYETTGRWPKTNQSNLLVMYCGSLEHSVLPNAIRNVYDQDHIFTSSTRICTSPDILGDLSRYKDQLKGMFDCVVIPTDEFLCKKEIESISNVLNSNARIFIYIDEHCNADYVITPGFLTTLSQYGWKCIKESECGGFSEFRQEDKVFTDKDNINILVVENTKTLFPWSNLIQESSSCENSDSSTSQCTRPNIIYVTIPTKLVSFQDLPPNSFDIIIKNINRDLNIYGKPNSLQIYYNEYQNWFTNKSMFSCSKEKIQAKINKYIQNIKPKSIYHDSYNQIKEDE